eukprot:jgi/Botrbrau1/19974/Bobra.0059s0089.1
MHCVMTVQNRQGEESQGWGLRSRPCLDHPAPLRDPVSAAAIAGKVHRASTPLPFSDFKSEACPNRKPCAFLCTRGSVSSSDLCELGASELSDCMCCDFFLFFKVGATISSFGHIACLATSIQIFLWAHCLPGYQHPRRCDLHPNARCFAMRDVYLCWGEKIGVVLLVRFQSSVHRCVYAGEGVFKVIVIWISLRSKGALFPVLYLSYSVFLSLPRVGAICTFGKICRQKLHLNCTQELARAYDLTLTA